MTVTSSRPPMTWASKVLIGMVLILAGAAAAVWALAHYPSAVRLLGIPTQPAVRIVAAAPATVVNAPATAAQVTPTNADDEQRIASLESRLAQVEQGTNRAVGSAGRADALVIAFAARRAIDRGVALGFLENLLVDHFGKDHRQSVATIITASHRPVLLNDLAIQYDDLGPTLRSGGAGEGWWSATRRELGSLIQLRDSSRQPSDPEARYLRARQRLEAGEVDQALAETMRLPGAGDARPWIDEARRYIAVHRALDDIESAALLRGPAPAVDPAATATP